MNTPTLTLALIRGFRLQKRLYVAFGSGKGVARWISCAWAESS